MTRQVTVFVGAGNGVAQPDTFRCCPLGVQFYADRELPTYEVLEIEIQAPSGNGASLPVPLKCSGVIVHCQKDLRGDRHRVWLMFLDIAEDARRQLQCFGKTGDFLCPHCENY